MRELGNYGFNFRNFGARNPTDEIRGIMANANPQNKPVYCFENGQRYNSPKESGSKITNRKFRDSLS